MRRLLVGLVWNKFVPVVGITFVLFVLIYCACAIHTEASKILEVMDLTRFD